MIRTLWLLLNQLLNAWIVNSEVDGHIFMNSIEGYMPILIEVEPIND